MLRSKGLFKEACRAGLRQEGQRGRSVGWERIAAGLHDRVLWGVAVVAIADPVPACREAPRFPRSRARSNSGSLRRSEAFTGSHAAAEDPRTPAPRSSARTRPTGATVGAPRAFPRRDDLTRGQWAGGAAAGRAPAERGSRGGRAQPRRGGAGGRRMPEPRAAAPRPRAP